MPLALLNGCVQQELAAVERAFADELQSHLPCVNALVRHVGRFRGKMLRPSLVLLCGKASGELSDAHIVLATVVEMVHMATLVHDDVLDEAELRRKGATINHLKGNEAAVMLGDYLISHSFHLCSSLKSQFASRLIGHTTNQVCEGELLQIHNRHNLDLDEATYLQVIALKTASLCAACCVLGSRYAGAEDVQVERLAEYGRSLGLAFQIQDDILDIVGSEGVVGKTLGTDLEKGKLTLPMIHCLRGSSAQRQALRALLAVDAADRAERVRALLMDSGSMDYARERASQHVARAVDALECLPDSEARRLLRTMAEYVIARPM